MPRAKRKQGVGMEKHSMPYVLLVFESQFLNLQLNEWTDESFTKIIKATESDGAQRRFGGMIFY